MSSNTQTIHTRKNKTRRKLPLTPEQLTLNNSKTRSRSADSRLKTEQQTPKERLKKHLRGREVQRRAGSSSERSEDEEDSSDASVASSKLYSSANLRPPHRQRSTSFGAHDKAIVYPSSRARSSNRTSRLEEFLNSKPNHKLSASKSDLKSYENVKQSSNAKYKSHYTRDNTSTSSKYYKTPKVEMVTIHGIQVPLEIKSLKQRIREELQIVTASRRLRLDEEEEVRRMEAELLERERRRCDRRSKNSRSHSPVYFPDKEDGSYKRQDANKFSRHKKTIYLKDKRLKGSMGQKYQQQEDRNYYKDNTDIRFKNKSDDQYLKILNKSRHAFKRQNSDPMLSNIPFSSDTICSDKTPYTRQNRSQEYSDTYKYKDTDYHRYKDTDYNRYKEADYNRYNDSRHKMKSYLERPEYADVSRSTMMLSKVDKRGMVNSRSACNLLKNNHYYADHSAEYIREGRRFDRTPSFSRPDENEDPGTREEKKEQLRLEIELRKLQLEEAKYIQEQIRRLAAMPDISSNDLTKARNMYRQHKTFQDQFLPSHKNALPSQNLSFEASLHNEYLRNIHDRSPFPKIPFSDAANLSQYYPRDYSYKPYPYNYDLYQSKHFHFLIICQLLVLKIFMLEFNYFISGI